MFTMIAHNLEKFVDVIFMYTYMYVRVCLQQSFNAAMVSALKALQKKIRGLEVDRVIAGERLKHLSEEAQRHPQLLLNQEKTPVPSHPYSPNTTSDQHGWLTHNVSFNVYMYSTKLVLDLYSGPVHIVTLATEVAVLEMPITKMV